MKLIPTFCNSIFQGYYTLKEVNDLKSAAYKRAIAKQRIEKAAHMIYAYFDYDTDGNIVTARVYMDACAKTDEDFDIISRIKSAHIYAIHGRY